MRKKNFTIKIKNLHFKITQLLQLGMFNLWSKVHLIHRQSLKSSSVFEIIPEAFYRDCMILKCLVESVLIGANVAVTRCY